MHARDVPGLTAAVVVAEAPEQLGERHELLVRAERIERPHEDEARELVDPIEVLGRVDATHPNVVRRAGPRAAGGERGAGEVFVVGEEAEQEEMSAIGEAPREGRDPPDPRIPARARRVCDHAEEHLVADTFRNPHASDRPQARIHGAVAARDHRLRERRRARFGRGRRRLGLRLREGRARRGEDQCGEQE